MTSQHPYAEQFLGEPYVYTIDIKNIQQVKDTVARILHRNEVSFFAYIGIRMGSDKLLDNIMLWIHFNIFMSTNFLGLRKTKLWILDFMVLPTPAYN